MTSTKHWMQYLSIGLGLILGMACVAADSWAATAKSTITFDNQSGEPALVKLVSKSTDQAVEQVEVPSGATRTVHAPGGEYYLLARYGADDQQYHYAKGQSFTVTETATKYSETTITLHKVLHGNYATKPTSKEEFERAQVAQREPISPEGAPKTEIQTQVAQAAGGGDPNSLTADSPNTPSAPASESTKPLSGSAGETDTPAKKTLRLKVEQDFGGASPRFSGEPEFADLLKKAGFEIVGEGAESVDGTIKVQVTGRALSSTYYEAIRKRTFGVGESPVDLRGPGETRYSGATIEGTLVVEASTGSTLKRVFSSRMDPSGEIYTDMYKRESDAPFRTAFLHSDCFGVLGDALEHTFGSESVIWFWSAAMDTSGSRRRASEALAKMGQSAFEPLRRLLKHPEPEVRHIAVKMLGNLKEASALVTALGDEDQKVRASAKQALSKIGPSAVLALLGALKADDPAIRRNAVEALGDIGDASAKAPLTEALQDSNVYVREAATEALAKFK